MMKLRPKIHQHFRGCQSRFRKKCLRDEGQMPDLQREKENVAKSIGQDDKRNDMVTASGLAKEFFTSKETAGGLHETKAHLNSISSQLGESIVNERTNHISKNSELIKLVDNLMKAPEVAAVVDNSSKQHVRERFTDIAMKNSKLHPSSYLEPVTLAKPVSPRPAGYNRLMKAFSRVGKVKEVTRLFSEMKESPCSPNVLCFNTVLNCLVTMRRFKEALAVLLEMLYMGIDPNVSTYNILVKLCCCYTDQLETAFQVLEWMSEKGLKPDVMTYSTLIIGLSRLGRIEDAYTVLDIMVNENCYPNVCTFTPIVQGLCAQGRTTDAKEVMELMSRNGCPPNSVAYNILIDALCKLGNFDEVDSILKESESMGWRPNAISHCIYINGLCQTGKIEEAYRQLQANNFLDWSVGLDWDVNFLSYNTVMNSFCNIGRWFTVLKLFTDMLKKGVDADTTTYNIVVSSLCKAGKLRKAKCMVHSRGFPVNVVAYNTLMNGYCRSGPSGDIAEVKYLHRRMNIVDKINPDMVTYTILIVMLCKVGEIREARSCFDEMCSMGFCPDLVLYSALIDGYFKIEQLYKGLQLLDIMLAHGLVPDFAIYHSVLRAYCREGFCRPRKISKVWITIEKMLAK